MQPLKVCVINPNYYRSSGVTIAIKRLREGMHTRPVEWLYVDCGYGKSEADPSFNSVKLQLMKPWLPGFWLSAWKLIKLMKAERVNLIHIHHRRLLLIIGGLAKLLGLPVVYTGHLVYGQAKITRLFKIDAAIAVTPSVMKEMETSIRASKVVTLSNGVAFPEKMPLLPSERKSVICIARLDPVKNHSLLIKAWALSGLANEGWRLILLGEGTLKLELQRYCVELEIYDSVEFRGFVPDVSAAISEAAFAVLPSFVEGQGLVTVECAAWGVPSLVSDVEGSRDCVPPNSQLPNLFAVDDPYMLASYLRSWATMGAALQYEAEIFFHFLRPLASLESVAKRTFDIYLSVSGHPHLTACPANSSQ